MSENNANDMLERAFRQASVVKASKGTITFRFGTNDIRFLATLPRMRCVRVYDDPPMRRECDHVHRSRAAAMRCAKEMGVGVDCKSRGRTWVEIVNDPLTEIDVELERTFDEFQLAKTTGEVV